MGTPWDPDPENLWTRVESMFDHLAAHAAEWWVAEDGAGKVIGHARSVERGGLFELSEFFVLPDRQAGGVGGQLLEKAFPLGRGDVRAIIATTDTRAMARYYRAGTAARFPIIALAGAPGVASGDGPLDRTLDVQPATHDDIPALIELERSVLGFERGDEFRWLHRAAPGPSSTGVAERVVGSAFLGRGGGIGPVSAADPADMPGILDDLERRAAEQEVAGDDRRCARSERGGHAPPAGSPIQDGSVPDPLHVEPAVRPVRPLHRVRAAIRSLTVAPRVQAQYCHE